MKPTPVLYLDLDGTVRHGKDELGHFVNEPSDVVIFPEALKLMRQAKPYLKPFHSCRREYTMSTSKYSKQAKLLLP